MSTSSFSTITVSALFLVSIIGCQKSPAPKGKTKGPLSVNQARSEAVVFGISESKAQQIALSESKPYRVLNRKHGGFAFKNLTVQRLQPYAPDAVVFQNRAVGSHSPANLQQKLHDFLVLDEKLEECEFDDEQGPMLVLKSNREDLDLEEEVVSVELGELIQLDATNSAPHPSHKSKLKIGMLIEPPIGSRQEARISLNGRLEFTPDAVGVYEVLTIVQDDRDLCSVQVSSFAATSNEPYAGRGPLHRSPDLGMFHHLEELDAKESWKISEGRGIVIAVIDSGVHYNHPDLRNNIYINEGEIPGNGIDDDHNGFVDDYTGYDLHSDDAFPFDDLGHGSHVAGLIASETFGLARRAQILPVKAGGGGFLDEGSLIAAILYAADMDVDIINMSFGDQSPINQYALAIDYLEEKGILAIASAGNGGGFSGFGVDTDKTPNFPSSDPSKNLISVAAKDSFNFLAPYSNYGKVSVDLTAPGGLDPDDLIMSTYAKNNRNITYHGQQGTSMATPLVAGIAAQVLSIRPDLSPPEVKQILMDSGTPVPGLERYVASSKTINALSSVEEAMSFRQVCEREPASIDGTGTAWSRK